MSKLLLLVHRIPFPPNKGDKIRSYHLLRHLARKHEIYLGSFVDDPDDWQYRGELEKLCREVKLITLEPRLRKLRSLSGLLRREALSLPYYRFAEMQRWVDDVIERRHVRHVVVFSSTMAQYVCAARHRGLVRIADLCDVDSDKWRQYADGRSGPSRAIYAREARTLLQHERAVAAEFDATLFVTDAEATLFRSLAPESAGRISHFDNGVDTDFFDPSGAYEKPFSDVQAIGAAPVVVFTGAMDYWANVDAVQWFVREVWPRVHAQRQHARLFIVGSSPGPEVRALEGASGVTVTGRVPDVRPYLAFADVSVAPLRIARGTQNKVLEALAMARPVVCTPAAASGLRVQQGPHFRIAEEPEAFASQVLELFGSGANPEGRYAVLNGYSWDAHLAVVDRLLDGAGHPKDMRAA